MSFDKQLLVQDLAELGSTITQLQRLQVRLAVMAQNIPDQPVAQQLNAPNTPSASEFQQAQRVAAGQPENVITDFGFRAGNHPRVVEAEGGPGTAPPVVSMAGGGAGNSPVHPGPTAVSLGGHAEQRGPNGEILGAGGGGQPISERVTSMLSAAPGVVHQRPTAEAARPAAQPTAAAPTEDQQRQALELEHRKTLDLLKNFKGSGSIFARYLSPDVIKSGKGALKPGRSGLVQYTEDVRQLTPQHLASWPSGFYRNNATSHAQFMMVSGMVIVVVDGLPENEADVTIHIRSQKDTVWSTGKPENLPFAQLIQLVPLIEQMISRIPTPTVNEMSN
jgi:hypothetical protein